jgi:hypothetical protein
MNMGNHTAQKLFEQSDADLPSGSLLAVACLVSLMTFSTAACACRRPRCMRNCLLSRYPFCFARRASKNLRSASRPPEFQDNPEPNNGVFREAGDQGVDIRRHEQRLDLSYEWTRLFHGAGIAISFFSDRLLHCHFDNLPNDWPCPLGCCGSSILPAYHQRRLLIRQRKILYGFAARKRTQMSGDTRHVLIAQHIGGRDLTQLPGETPEGHEAKVFLQAPDCLIVGAASCEARVREAAGRGDHCCSVAVAAQ